MKAIKCKTEYQINPKGIVEKDLYLSWQCQGGVTQTAYRIRVRSGQQMVLDTGKVQSDKMHAIISPEPRSREIMSWSVQLWDQYDSDDQWSDANSFEYGLLDESDWKAEWIDPDEDASFELDEKNPDPMNRQAMEAWKQKKHTKKDVYQPHKPASILRKNFWVDANMLGGKSRLYASACGLYEILLNGHKITEDVLTPGTANYSHEIPYQTYDVTDWLVDGENNISVTLGDGWYRSTSGVDGDRNLFGDKTAFLCQLEIDDQIVLVTDDTWSASTNGPLQQNDMQQGEVYDARLEDISEEDRGWHNVTVTDHNKNLLRAMDTLPIRRMESFEGKLFTTPKGDTVIDFGQNLAGQIEFEIPNGLAGQKLVLIHGETLDQNGEFTQENFQDRNRHKEGGTYQTVFYTCKDGFNHYIAKFTIMGFRYVKVESEADLSQARFTAYAVYSQMEETTSITTSNPLINQLVKNAIWSQKGNFCDIPTDCPTRERAGWTGDAGIFAYTGLRLMDSVPVWKKWLRQCRYTQLKDGKVMNIAPPNNHPGFFAKLLAGSVAWGDAVIIVPWEIYKLTGDLRILEENYEMMCRWYAFLEKEASKKKVFHKSSAGNYRKYVMEKGMNYGEWCEPGRSAAESMKDGNYDVATAYFAYSGNILSEIASLLGKSQDEINHYQRVADNAKKGYQKAFTEDGRIVSKRQCQYVRPLAFKLLSLKNDKDAVGQLAEMVREAEGRLNTGFLTTPDICRQLADRGYLKEAYQILLNEQMPGWLYEVKQGATTLWENWDGIQDGQEPKESLNHYSYGAIAGWILDGVCGIQYQDGQITIEPQMYTGTENEGLESASATYQSPAGTIEVSWTFSGSVDGKNCYKLCVDIPSGCTGSLILPDERIETVLPGLHQFEVHV